MRPPPALLETANDNSPHPDMHAIWVEEMPAAHWRPGGLLIPVALGLATWAALIFVAASL